MRKRLRVNAPEIERSTKAPIFYLRSFYYESIDKRLKELLEPEATLYERENDDEILARALKEIGPVITVGKPDRKIPPIGSIELYFENSEWREQVKKLIAISQLVIIQPGQSEGTEWEMSTVQQLCPLEKMEIPPEIITCQVTGHKKKTISGEEYLEITFRKNTDTSESMLFYGNSYEQGNILRNADWYLGNHTCRNKGTTWPSHMFIRRSLPWE